uniref:Nucleoside-diphosphate kinase n=2 Tax=Mesocestoides corti TaxID=53468 RepID=A0A5K3FTZ1_MESCO
MASRKPVIPPKETNEYLASHEIPQLFECLITGLMFHRPADPVQYIQECLEQIKRIGFRSVRWDLFVEDKRCVLPPLGLKRNTEPFSKYQPLVGTDCLRLRIRPQTSIICVLSPPGIDGFGFSERMMRRYPNFVHICMGDLAKNCAKIEERKPNSRWKDAIEYINSGDFAPEDMVLELLIWNLNQYPTSTGFIIDGYPRTFKQYDDLKIHIGGDRLSGVVLIDAPEEKCLRRIHIANQRKRQCDEHLSFDVVQRKMCMYKKVTLAMCKVIDDEKKLYIVDGEPKCDLIEREMLSVFEIILSKKETGPPVQAESTCDADVPTQKSVPRFVGCPGNSLALHIPTIQPDYKDTGRRPGLPTCPVLVLLGGPGSGRTKQSLALCKSVKGAKHYNLTDLLRTKVLSSLANGGEKDWDVVAKRVHSSQPPLYYDRLIPEYWDVQLDILREEFVKSAKCATIVIIEGYMNDEKQISTFNQTIGGADMIVLLDCKEEIMKSRLSRRCTRLKRIEDEAHIVYQRINFFKQVTLSVARYFDELGKLVIVPADREADLISKDLKALIEYFLAKRKSSSKNNCNRIDENNSSDEGKIQIQGDWHGYDTGEGRSDACHSAVFVLPV